MKKNFTLWALPCLKRSVLALLSLLTVSLVQAATFTSTAAGGLWGSTTTWTVTGTDGDGIPDGDDIVIITPGSTVTIAANGTASLVSFASGAALGKLAVNSSIVLNITTDLVLRNSQNTGANAEVSGAGTINVGGSLVFGNGTALQTNANYQGTMNLLSSIAALNISGNATVAGLSQNDNRYISASFTIGAASNVLVTGTVAVTKGASTNIGFTSTITNNATGVNAFTVGGTLSGIGTLTQGTNANLNLRGANTITIFTATASGNTANYSGGSQTIRNTSYQNLTTSGTGTKTITANITLGGNLTVNGTSTLDLGTFTANTTGASKTLQVANGATLRIGGTNTLPSGYIASPTFGTTSIVEYYGADQVVGTATYGNLLLSGTGNKSTAANIGVNGTMTVSNGVVFTPGATNTISGTGSLAGTGTIKVTRTGTDGDLITQYPIYAGNVPAIESLSVDYAGDGTQQVNAITYGNLRTSVSGTKTVTGTGALKVSGNLTVAEPTTLDVGDYAAENTSQGTGTLLVENGATLRVGGSHKLPTNFGTYSLQPTSTVNFYGGSGSNHFILTRTYGNLTLSDNTTVTATEVLTIVGNLRIGSGSTFNATNGATLAHTIKGNWINNGTYNASGNTKFTFEGSALQTIGGSAQTTFENLEVKNAFGITLDQTVGIGADGGNGTVTFTNGIINSSLTNLLIINENSTLPVDPSNASHVNGPVRKVGNDGFVFPVGKNGKYVPIAIGAPANTTDAFTAEYFARSAEALGTISTTARTNGLRAVSECEFWTLDRTAGSSSVAVTLSWGPNNACTGASYIGDPFFIVVAHHSGTSTPSSGQWNSFNRTSATGNQAAGTVTWNNVNTFSPFTLGSIDAAQAPLPVTFMSFEGKKAGNNTQLTWKVAGETNVAGYDVERKTSGGQYAKIGFVSATGSSSYTFTDAAPQKGVVFYRLKNVDNDGRFAYSTQLSFKNSTGIVVFPTVVTGRTAILHDAANANAWLTLSTVDGKQLKLQKPQAGSLQTKVDLNGLRPGIYLLKFNDGNGTIETVKLLKQ